MKNELITQLRHAESRSAVLTAIVESSDDAIISKDLQGKVTSWNLSAERIFGYTAAEMIGQSILTLIPVDLHHQESDILSRLANGERIDQFRTQRLTKAGKIIQVSLTISPVKDRNGGIIGVSKIARDITDQTHAAEQLSMLAAIIESSNDAIISKNLGSIITSWNRSAERIFGYRANEIIGKSILALIPSDLKHEESLILTKLKNGEPVEHFETQRITKSGSLIDVSLTISAIRDNRGEIIGLSQIARDITERKKEDQRKHDFISIVSHELKTPLTTMRSYVQLALAKDIVRADKATENILRRAEAQTTKMSAMIHAFLNLSRLEEGKMSLNCSIFPLDQLLEEVAEEARMLSLAHHIVLEASCAVDIDADRDKIYQVITNLLTNAIKYSDKGTTIRISCYTIDDQVTIEVQDHGTGIPEKDQPRLFERFYRVREEQNKHIGGFGIGLYLVSELLRLHGSKINVKSKPGEGSTFSFSLPVCSSMLDDFKPAG